MGRVRYNKGRGFDIPWAEAIDILCIGGSKYHR
jgi:hypothetical protein